MNIAERRDRVLRILRKRNRYQFGQPYDRSNLVGNSGCTDTAIQLIVWMATGKRVSLNAVRRRSGARAGYPMLTSHAIRALASYGLSYEVRVGLKASEATKIARTKGPVIVAEKYWAHPQWRGYSYMGRKLWGWATSSRGQRIRVGVSKPYGRSGLTQWTFRDGHAVLLATDVWEPRVGNDPDAKKIHFAVVRDSNHNSPSRPERPAFDLVTMGQLNRMLNSWPGGSICLVPRNKVIN